MYIYICIYICTYIYMYIYTYKYTKIRKDFAVKAALILSLRTPDRCSILVLRNKSY